MQKQSSFKVRTLNSIKDLSRLHHNWPRRYPFALISSAQKLNGKTGKAQARFDILFAYPQQQLTLDNKFQLSGLPLQQNGNDFLSSFDQWFKKYQIAPQESELPFTGGWFIYLAYEIAQQVEPCLNLPVLPDDQPVACATRIPAAIIIDHQNNTACIVAENEHQDLLDKIEQDYHQLDSDTDDTEPATTQIEHFDEETEQDYLKQLARIKQYIVDGDIFQANLSRQWRLKVSQQISDRQLFISLAKSNPASFAAIANFDNFTVISSSPERLVRVRDGRVETRPIAGTRPRSRNQQQDTDLSTELMSHPKEQAEHIMLIDLERNDLGRICQPGSIEVNELLTLESWQHVHHIVSNVRGTLKTNIMPGEVLRAVFPGGTITGCPKVRCMQILAEQEQQPRGSYTGSLGYINRDGSMDTSILIRTMTRQADQIHFRAGGGIVADSDAQAELAETRAKAKGILDAFKI